MAPKKFPGDFKSYPASAVTFTIDKTGTIYQTNMGDLNKTAQFGLRVLRTKPGKPTEEIFFNGGHGELCVINKKLYIGYTDPNWISWYDEIPGYIDAEDTPSSKVVNVDESAMDVYKKEVLLAQKTANNAQYNASAAQTSITNLTNQVNALNARIDKMEVVIAGLQKQVLSRQQIEDIVWSKIWDVNYLIREGFRNGSSAIREVQDYLVDLASYIRRIKP